MKIEKDINKELLVMKKNDETSEALYTRLRSTGAQPARLYGLAKVHKQGTPLPRPVLSLPDSSYDNLKNIDKILSWNWGDTHRNEHQMAREILEKNDLDSDEGIMFLDVNSLYTNVPLEEGVEIAPRRLIEQVKPPETSRKTMKKLLNLAVRKINAMVSGMYKKTV